MTWCPAAKQRALPQDELLAQRGPRYAWARPLLFFTLTFLFWFLPVVLLGHAALPARSRNLWLLLASCVFYAFASIAYMPLLVFSIAFDYVAGARIARSERPGERRAWLVFSIAVNLGLLGYFKYSNLFTTTLREQFGLLSVPLIEAALPVGISFYTFQSMSYTIDLYRREVQPAPSFISYAAFVSMFPQLIAGPIIRYSEIAGQLAQRTLSLERLAKGIFLLILGMAKKLLVADRLAALATPLFGSADPGVLGAWTAMFLFAGQIYFDFSGYSDMAIGLGHMFGFDFPQNFDSPYKASSFSDFWRRWHITLSVWLRDYLYVPLGGNRRGAARTYVNLMTTMLLGGIWHGASWNFALWGLLHGLFLAGERLLRTWLPGRALPLSLRRVLVFLGVTLAWVPFKFEHLAQARLFWSAMFGAGTWRVPALPQLLGVLACFVLIWLPRHSGEWRISFSHAQTAYALALFAIAILVGYGSLVASPFLYFRF